MDLELPQQELRPDLRPGELGSCKLRGTVKKKKKRRKKEKRSSTISKNKKQNKIRKIKNMLGKIKL